MPTFETPGPINATIELAIGDVRVIASDRTDTVVEVRPANPDRELDVKYAQQSKVEYAGGRLLVKGHKPRNYSLGVFGISKIGQLDIVVELPAGSAVEGESASSRFLTEGALGNVRFRTAAGNVTIEQGGAMRLHTGAGTIAVDRALGDVEAHAATGDIRFGEIVGDAILKNSNGDTRVGLVTGNIRVNSANGKIAVDRAQGDVTTKTANGSIRLGEVVRGSVSLDSAVGGLEIGISEGTAAWLDVRTMTGGVRNTMEATNSAEGSAETVQVRARTYAGDILIHRAHRAA